MVRATSLLLTLGALAGSALAVDIPVAVAESGLEFVPSSIEAAVGDTVTFTFINGRHTVTQSSLENPCQASSPGFASGVIQTGTTYTLAITSTDPIYYFCEVGAHCTSGMVGGINLPGNFDAFLAAAGNDSITAATTVVPSGVGAVATVLAEETGASSAMSSTAAAGTGTTTAAGTGASTAAPAATSMTGGASAVKLSGAALFLATVFGAVAL